jgi:hypothetical protein
VVFALAQVLRTKQFLRADDLRAVFGQPLCLRERLPQILRRIFRATRLDQSNVDDVRLLGRQRFENGFG